ncbi:MAG: hypothetical protein ABIA59_09340, partial [Candidatus Latescibacterota bacterium]
MIPDKYMELINQEIDGTNSSARSAELGEYMKEHPEALRCFDELNELTRSFSQMGAVDPPAELRALILSRIAESAAERSLAVEAVATPPPSAMSSVGV